LDSELAKQEREARTALIKLETAVQGVRDRARSEIDRVGIPADRLSGTATRFIRELSNCLNRRAAQVEHALEQFVEVENHRFADSLRTDVFRIYIPFHVIEFHHDKQGAIRSHPIFPSFLRSSSEKVGRIRKWLKALQLGENEYKPLCQYVWSGLDELWRTKGFDKALSRISKDCDLMQNDDFGKIVEKGAALLRERNWVTKKLAERIQKLGMKISKLRLNTRGE
jgi:hypothetical protein